MAEVPRNKRFRANAADLFLSNTISAARAATLFDDAAEAGTGGISDLRVGVTSNTHRNLLRRLLKHSAWPPLYFAELPVWNRRTAEETTAWIPMLLPHELAVVMHAHRGSDMAFFDQHNLDNVARQHLQDVQREIGFNGPFLGVGLWQDGVAAKWDRSASIDMLCMSFPGLAGRWNKLRIPLMSIDHVWVAKQKTFDAALAVVAWSLQALALGCHPSLRHDGRPWLPTDKRRKQRSRMPLPFRGALCQFTGDWKAYKELFRVPQFNENAGCCYKCRIVPDGIRETGPNAPWRRDRLDHWGFLARLRQHGLQASPLFSAPGFRVPIIRLDWLHVMDLGVCADWLGQLFRFLLPKFDGRNDKARIAGLWRRIQALYVVYPPFAKLDNLTLNMLSPNAPAAKLRCYGSESRGLIPVAQHLAEEMLNPADPVEQTVRKATADLAGCCRAASVGAPTADCSRRFATLWVALERHLPETFRIKPKLHFMQELLEMEDGRPMAHSTYREEEFGGSVAALGRRLGGHNTAASVGTQTLLRFCARHKVPRIDLHDGAA